MPALGRSTRCVRSLARRLSLAEEVVDRPLAVVRGDGLLGEGGHDLLPGQVVAYGRALSRDASMTGLTSWVLLPSYQEFWVEIRAG